MRINEPEMVTIQRLMGIKSEGGVRKRRLRPNAGENIPDDQNLPAQAAAEIEAAAIAQ